MAHIWCLDKWEDVVGHQTHTGLRLRFEPGVDEEVRAFLLDFARWLRKEFLFPLRLNVYVKRARRIRAMDGEYVVGTMWRPASYDTPPHIRLATGDYDELVADRGKENAKWAILHTFAHELTHYYQHINDLQLTPRGEERQATIYAGYILSDYAESLQTIEQSDQS